MHALPRMLAILLLALALVGTTPAPATAAGPVDWTREFEVAPGLGLAIDSEGFERPSAIALVPRPGPRPNDPLYFVLELRGRVKAVLRNGTVQTFTEDLPRVTPEAELPDPKGQVGAAGLCLDSTHGYLFVTFAYRDGSGSLRNGIERLDSTPGTFGTRPTGHRRLAEVFGTQPSGLAHQIGGCTVAGGRLFVGVGDAWRPADARRLGVLTGKVLRMTLDGVAEPSNPFFEPRLPSRTAGYVFAVGLRNPFGLVSVGSRLLAADNGVAVDRLVEVRRGGDYLWDGHDWSIGARANLVIAPSPGVTAAAWTGPGGPVWPEAYARHVVLGTYGGRERAGLVAVEYDVEAGLVTAAPRHLVQHRPTAVRFAPIVAVASHGGQLYFAPLLGREGEPTPVLRLERADGRQDARPVLRTRDPVALMTEKGCLGCHKTGRERGALGRPAPPLDDPAALAARLERVLESEAYRASLEAVDRLNQEPQRRFATARREVLAARGPDRVRTWLVHRLLEPRFDRTESQMPNLGLSEPEARVIADYLVAGPEGGRGGLAARLHELLPAPVRLRHVLAAFAAGLVAGATLVTVRFRRA